jgi:hypothetical protein
MRPPRRRSDIAGFLADASEQAFFTFLPHRTLFDPLRQFLVAGSNLAHRLLSISVVYGFRSS